MKKKTYEGRMDDILAHKIVLNINHLEKGIYELNIMHKNKVIKSMHFTKK